MTLDILVTFSRKGKIVLPLWKTHWNCLRKVRNAKIRGIASSGLRHREMCLEPKRVRKLFGKAFKADDLNKPFSREIKERGGLSIAFASELIYIFYSQLYWTRLSSWCEKRDI